MSGPSERAVETAICESLVTSGGYTAGEVGNAAFGHAGITLALN